MATAIGLLVGMVIGGLASGSSVGTLLGGIVGAFVGFLIAGRRERRLNMRPSSAAVEPASPVAIAPEGALSIKVAGLERRVAELERALLLRTAPLANGSAMTPPVEPESAITAAPEVAAAPAPGDIVPSLAPTAPVQNADGSLTAPTPAVEIPPTPPLPPSPPAPTNIVWAWMIGGNTLARVGVVLLFIGVGFLLKYAVEHVQVPVSLRLTGVALGGVALLVLGWRLRGSRRAYAMVLQGGGVGVLYLTVFAALRLYALVPPLAAFGLLVWISAVSSWLAVRQDAISLAVLAVAGGFLAPILTSSQSRQPRDAVQLLRAPERRDLGIAWFKAWRALNLLGFAFTFLVGTFWGVTRYRPELSRRPSRF